MDLATSRRDDRAQGETELTVVDESGLSSQRATESFGNEQRCLKPDSGCFGGPPLSNEPLRSSIAWMALWSVTSVPGRSGSNKGSGHIQPKTSIKDLDLPPYSAMAGRISSWLPTIRDSGRAEVR
jgi:hypothetical protein